MSSNTMRSVMSWNMSSLQLFIRNIFPTLYDAADLEAGTAAVIEGLKTARVVVHKDTWSLHNSGRRVPKFKNTVGQTVHSFRFGGYIVNPKTGRVVDYAHDHESYLRRVEGRGYMEAGVKVMSGVYKQTFRVAYAQRKITGMK